MQQRGPVPGTPLASFMEAPISTGPQMPQGPMQQPGPPPGVQVGGVRQGQPPQMIEMKIQEAIQAQPALVVQLQQAVQEAVANGELTQVELNTMLQLANTALRNPGMYPQIRQFAIQQGLATEQDLPPGYDEGLVIAVIVAGRAAQASVGGQDMVGGGNARMAQPLTTQPPGKGGRDDQSGDYVIPRRVVDMKGREFFDRMLEQYKETNEQ